MAIYFILLGLLCGLYLLQGRHQIARADYLEVETNHRRTIPGMILFCGLLAFMIAFRGPEIGTDTPMYQYLYKNRDLDRIVHSSLLWLESVNSTEPGYTILMYLLDKLGLNFRAMTVLEALIYMIPVGILVYRYSRNPYLSLFFFVCMDYFGFALTGMRQTIAMGICILAFLEMRKGKTLRFLLLTVLACFFHKSALCFFPVCILERFPLNRKFTVAALVVGVLAVIFKDPLRQFLLLFSRLDYEMVETGGDRMYLFMASMLVLDIFILKNKTADREDVNIFRYMMLAAVIMFPVLQFNAAVFRLHFYYSLMMIVYLPNVLRKIKNLYLRLGIEGGYVAVAVYYMVRYPLDTMDIVPYVCTWLM